MGKKLSRAFKYLRRFVATVVVLVILALVFIHSPWGKSIVRARIESRIAAAFDGRATLGRLDYGFLFSSVELGDLEIRDRQGRPAIRIASITADLDRGSLLAGTPIVDSLAVRGLQLEVIEDAAGVSNLVGIARPARPGDKPVASITIRAFTVTGGASITRADGTVATMTDLAVAGHLVAQPATKAFAVTLGPIAAKVRLARPHQPARDLALAIASATLSRATTSLDATVAGISLGASTIQSVAAHANIVGGRLVDSQSIALTKLHVDHETLHALVGKKLTSGDVDIDATLEGPAAALVLRAAAKTRDTTLAVDGTIDASNHVRPRYHLVLSGKGKSVDLGITRIPAVATELRIIVDGAGIRDVDLDTAIGIEIGATTIGNVAVASISAAATARHRAYRLERLTAKGLGFEIGATGTIAPDLAAHARVTVAGDPAETIRVLHEAGVEVPRQLPQLGKIALVVTADGALDRKLVVALEPAQLALAGGSIDVAGSIHLENRKLADATTTISLRRLDLAGLAHLAGRPATVRGSLSGTVTIGKLPTDQLVDYDVAIQLRDPALTIAARGPLNDATASVDAKISHAGIHYGSITARLPRRGAGLASGRRWHVVLDAPQRSISDLVTLVPPAIRAKLPPDLAGDLAMHAELGGTPGTPTGTIVATVTGTRHGEVRATVGPAANGRISIATTGTFGVGEVDTSIVGSVTLGNPFLQQPRDLVVDQTLTLAARPIGSLPKVPPRIAALGGTVDATLHVTGAPRNLALVGAIGLRGYRTASGGVTDTTIALTGTPTHLVATVDHAHAVSLELEITRRSERVDILARAHADDTALLPLLPALLPIPPGAELGRFRWAMQADVGLVLATRKLDRVNVTGSLAITGGSFVLPHTGRSWRGIDLEIAGDPDGVRLVGLELHERDRQRTDRTLHASGLLAITDLKPTRLALALRSRNWLLLGTTSPLLADAPQGEIDLDAQITADLSKPIIGIDATFDHLDLRAPDRHDRAHQPERASIAGDVIFVDATTRPGALPVPPPRKPLVAPPGFPSLDLRVHLPNPVHLQKAPLDVMARGEVVVTVRPEAAIVPDGTLELVSGSIGLFGFDHPLVHGRITVSAAHPTGWLDLRFERKLPDAARRDRADPDVGARISVSGKPAQPDVAFSGAINASLPEVFSLYASGRSVFAPRLGIPASTMVQTPRGDQVNILAYVSLALPHLLVLDRASAWADATEARGTYGRIRNLELDRYWAGDAFRFRAVGRPTAPGRSTGELQLDHLFAHDARRAFGVGLRAGDRLGGGVGLFFDWSSIE
ncbi:MAG: translocation/assembly module TamB domain-containing protein [Kofleriaceae bacterium]